MKPTSPRQGILARIGAHEPAPPWSLSTVVISILAAVIAMFAGTFVALAWFEGATFAGVAGWTIGGVLGALFVYQMLRKDREALRLARGMTPIPFVMFITVGFALLFDLISLALTGVFTPSPELALLPVGALAAADWLFAILLMVAAQPAVEELVFRGVALPSLRSRLGGWGGVLVCALLSMGFHLLIYPPTYRADVSALTPLWYGAALPFLDALLLCGVRAATGSTRAAVAAHAVLGLFAVVKLVLIA
jgi:membrane protease YdiL (CAAX protease family)